MPIRINRIDVKGLGPLADLQLELSDFNLIYGGNEHGKTLLVEFLIRSLFKKHKPWNLRDTAGRGAVEVAGFEEGVVRLTARSPQKLDTLWEKSERGLPPDLARLLVIKGAELSLAADPSSGTDHDIVKKYLSSSAVLDRIQGNISANLKATTVEGGVIVAKRKAGEISNREDARNALDKYDALLSRVDGQYSSGPTGRLEEKIATIKAELAALEAAKHHQAYLLSRQLSEKRSAYSSSSSNDADQLATAIRSHELKVNDLARAEADLRQQKPEVEHYGWLSHAVEIYRRHQQQAEVKARPLWLYLALLSFAVSVVAYLINQPVAAVAAIVLGLVLGYLYIHELRLAAATNPAREEVESILQEFSQRFGQPASGLASLEHQLQEVGSKAGSVKRIENDIEQYRSQVAEATVNVHQLMKALDMQPESGGWSEQLRHYRSARDRARDEITQHEADLARLNVETEEYLAEHPGHEFNPARSTELRHSLSEADESLRQSSGELQLLRQEIAIETGEPASAPWTELLARLRARREEAAADYRSRTSAILAKIAVNQIVETLRKEELRRIRVALADDDISRPLRQVTGRYEQISLSEDEGSGYELLVRDSHDEFPLKDLSTGAREQVLLALRIGFAARILGREQLFLILDDAFQHADWRRRSYMVNQVADLAEAGWQIIYFTMDDHIRDLFREVGTTRFQDRFVYHDLSTHQL